MSLPNGRLAAAAAYSGGGQAGGACVLFLVAPEGVLRETVGIDEAEAVEGVEWVRAYRQPGWHFGPLRRGAYSLGPGRKPQMDLGS